MRSIVNGSNVITSNATCTCRRISWYRMPQFAKAVGMELTARELADLGRALKRSDTGGTSSRAAGASGRPYVELDSLLAWWRPPQAQANAAWAAADDAGAQQREEEQ
jgi:hypothetical protein